MSHRQGLPDRPKVCRLTTMTMTATRPTITTTRAEVRALARELMDKHGLQGWHFKFDSAKGRAGRCTYSTKTIQLSLPIAQVAGIEGARMTILHEIAHALVGPGYGHGWVWQTKCLSIGGNGRRCSGTVETAIAIREAHARYEVRCTSDDKVLERVFRSNYKVDRRQCRSHRCAVYLWDTETSRKVK